MTNPSRHSLDLATLQRWMQSVVTHPGGIEPGILAPESQGEIPLEASALEQVVLPSRAMSAMDRLAVYGNAYFARLLDCLRELFPALHFTLGDEPFDALAFGYLERHPSTSYTLGHLARRFVGDLEATRPQIGPTEEGNWADFVIDLARLEWTIDEVFDGPGEEEQPSRIADQLAGVPVEDLPDLRLEVSRSLRLLELRFPLDEFYSAARGKHERELPRPAASYLVVWRRNYVVRRWSISREAFAVLREIANGASLSAALERAAESSADVPAFIAQVPEWFRSWGAAGMIVDVAS